MRRLAVCLAGTWDREFGRNQILQRLLLRAGCDLTLCQVDLWGRRGDSIVRRGRLAVLARALAAYPRLVWRFFRMRRPDLVIVPYPGHFDMPLLALLCRLRRVPLVFDVFISLFDTIVTDRALAAPRSITGRLARAIDRLSIRLADRVLADTPPHAAYFAELSGTGASHFRVLWVGARGDLFRPAPSIAPEPDLVLFYGTFVPLHGAAVIAGAAGRLASAGMRVRIIGDGQDRAQFDRLLTDPARVERVDRVPLEQLPREIARAGICLGVFGTTPKAERVVPAKVWECVAVGRPVVTADTGGIRSAFAPGELETIPAGDPAALAAAVLSLRADRERRERIAAAGHQRYLKDYSEDVLAGLLRRHLEELLPPAGRD